MPTKTIMALRGEISIHGRPYEMYCGYMTPNELISMTSVPSFERDTSHHSIANSLKNLPIDHWQRPLDTDRLKRIRGNVDAANLANSDKDSLMANPVLIGRSDKVGQTGVALTIDPHTVRSGQANVTVAGVHNIKVTSQGGNKPLWILDGQHRIHGLGNSPKVVDDTGGAVLNGSIVADEAIPVVFIVDDAYTPEFLAQIFTEVTTEAKPMETLHGDWMKYSFEMGDYKESQARNGMEATVELATIQNVDGAANEFCAAGGQIKFNPHLDTQGVGPLALDAVAFRKWFEDQYYRTGGTASAEKLATAFVRFFRAARNLDTGSYTDSRLMGPYALTVLAEKFFHAFLNHLATDATLIGNTQNDWEAFLKTSERQFDVADWSLPDVTPGSTQSNVAYRSSPRAAEITFDHFFNNPEELEDEDPAAWLLGPGLIQVQTAALTTGGKFPHKKHTPRPVLAAGGTTTIRLRPDSHKMVRFRSIGSSQATIVSIERKEGKDLVTHKADSMFVLEPGNKTESFKVNTICFSEDSLETTTFKFIS